jgi:hypothetical protein
MTRGIRLHVLHWAAGAVLAWIAFGAWSCAHASDRCLSAGDLRDIRHAHAWSTVHRVGRHCWRRNREEVMPHSASGHHTDVAQPQPSPAAAGAASETPEMQPGWSDTMLTLAPAAVTLATYAPTIEPGGWEADNRTTGPAVTLAAIETPDDLYSWWGAPIAAAGLAMLGLILWACGLRIRGVHAVEWPTFTEWPDWWAEGRQ